MSKSGRPPPVSFIMVVNMQHLSYNPQPELLHGDINQTLLVGVWDQNTSAHSLQTNKKGAAAHLNHVQMILKQFINSGKSIGYEIKIRGGWRRRKQVFTSVKTKTLFISVLKGCGKWTVLTKSSTLFCEERKNKWNYYSFKSKRRDVNHRASSDHQVLKLFHHHFLIFHFSGVFLIHYA